MTSVLRELPAHPSGPLWVQTLTERTLQTWLWLGMTSRQRHGVAQVLSAVPRGGGFWPGWKGA